MLLDHCVTSSILEKTDSDNFPYIWDEDAVCILSDYTTMAYTPSLDAENEAFINGDSAPEYVTFIYYAIVES